MTDARQDSAVRDLTVPLAVLAECALYLLGMIILLLFLAGSMLCAFLLWRENLGAAPLARSPESRK